MGRDKYLKLMAWLRKRYTEPGGMLVHWENGKPSKYSRIESMAFEKYFLGRKSHG